MAFARDCVYRALSVQSKVGWNDLSPLRIPGSSAWDVMLGRDDNSAFTASINHDKTASLSISTTAHNL